MGFGARIAELRRNRKQSLQDVADAVGVTKTHIWELERARTGNPSLKVIQGIADHFGVSVAFLVGEDPEAVDADQNLARMFRLAGKLEEGERQIIDDLIKSFLARQRQRGDSQS